MTAFRDLHTQSKAAAYLKRAILSDRVSHAYLFCGPMSEGLPLAQAFAAALQCTTLDSMLHMPELPGDDAGRGGRRADTEDPRQTSPILPEEVDACGRCRSCIQALDGNQPDLLLWTHEKPKTFTVEDARSLVTDVQIRPFQSQRKVYIIPDAHLMNAEAQNTLLKTLEEPPGYAHLLLLCESSDRMLETIRSRCVQIDLDPAASALEGDALSLAMQILLNVSDWTIPQIQDAVTGLEDYSLTIGTFLDHFSAWYRDLLYYKATGDADGLLNGDYITEIDRACARTSYAGISGVLDAVTTASKRLGANVNFDLTMEMLLLSMKDGAAEG